ncbi:hypothetical protein ATE92_2461 [Ulvibacter sp. MAR_2010_11]|uniref:hypothetical protein n=1 Tax=Ulvibacter sp. MAR_2010_11 TaxID=1250229 RepID=UPI000CAECB15|nr:hypothetical protein [Ulvibacter sp. MAR_2010_11]PKA84280.1 hypothetical protein ATE92_2461 [Ulvibacter sp. MAR_2010_11]
MNKKSRLRKRSAFFLIMGIVGLFSVLIGFTKTFFVPVSFGTFNAPAIIYVHGILAFCWVFLYFTQAFLIRKNRYLTHKRLGIIGLIIAIGIAVTMIPAGKFQVEKELAMGFGDSAISAILGVFISALMFLLLVFYGIYKRRVPQTHKRVMLLALLVLLWPAWFRFRHYFPSIPNPEIWFAVVLADSFIVISMFWDKIANGKIHPAFLYIGTFIIVEHIFEVLMFDSSNWRVIAKTLYGWL